MVTVLGASGFIGSHLVNSLISKGIDYYAPVRDENLSGRNLGDLVYCIGLTSDFRNKPYDTFESHICKLSQVLQHSEFNSFTYLSSTRIYINNVDKVDENSKLTVDVNDPNDLFNISKIGGEVLIMNSKRNKVRIIRLSNVYGDDYNSTNFLSSIIKDAILLKKVVLHSTADSAKDYISVKDAVDLILNISLTGKNQIYNVATGFNIRNDEILNIIQAETGCNIEYHLDSKKIIFPIIDNNRIVREFKFFSKETLLQDLPSLIQGFRTSLILK
jgi:nucleoside-diphosphate-sugar epimerase